MTADERLRQAARDYELAAMRRDYIAARNVPTNLDERLSLAEEYRAADAEALRTWRILKQAEDAYAKQSN